MTTAEDIKARVSVFEVAEELALDVRHDNKTWAFDRDETEPSIQLYEDHWFDYGAGVGGSVVDLVMAYYGCSFRRALQWFEGLGIDDVEPKVRKSVKPEPVDFTQKLYAQLPDVDLTELYRVFGEVLPTIDTERVFRLHLDVIEGATTGLVIPHWHEQKAHAVKVRWPDGRKTSWPGSQFDHLYQRVNPKPAPAEIILCEGESDTWWMDAHFHGDPGVGVVGLPSGINHWRPEWKDELLRDGAMVYICTDNDEQGRAGRFEILRKLGYRAKNLYVPGNHKDVREALAYDWKPEESM